MSLSLLSMAFLACGQGQLKYVKVFPGGTYEEYIRFVNTNGAVRDGNVSVFIENLFPVMGPTRCVVKTDDTTSFDPPIPKWMSFSKKGSVFYMASKLLPVPYCRPEALKKQGDTDGDIMSYFQSDIQKGSPGITGSFKLGNGLSQLGYRLEIHPFYDDMRVKIRLGGNIRPELVEAIAATVGAEFVKQPGVPIVYRLEPNVEEIRTRALATMEFFGPSSPSETETLREKLRYDIIRDCPTPFLRRWIDASKKRDRSMLTDEPWAKDVRLYRDKLIDEVAKVSPGALKYLPSDYKSMPIYFDMEKYLSFGVTLLGPNGTLIHL